MTFEACIHCGEPIALTDRLAPGYVSQRVHWECGLRAVVGGVNHLRGTCSCCGGADDPDPPGMTRREAARATVEEWKRQREIERSDTTVL